MEYKFLLFAMIILLSYSVIAFYINPNDPKAKDYNYPDYRNQIGETPNSYSTNPKDPFLRTINSTLPSFGNINFYSSDGSVSINPNKSNSSIDLKTMIVSSGSGCVPGGDCNYNNLIIFNDLNVNYPGVIRASRYENLDSADIVFYTPISGGNGNPSKRFTISGGGTVSEVTVTNSDLSMDWDPYGGNIWNVRDINAENVCVTDDTASYPSRTCMKTDRNFLITSPDGTPYNCGTTNGGVFSCGVAPITSAPSGGGTALLDFNAFVGDYNVGDYNNPVGTRMVLTNDMYYRDLNNYGTINTAGYRIFARTLYNHTSGIIDNNGNGDNTVVQRAAGTQVAGTNLGGGGAASAGGLGTTGTGACTAAPTAATGMGGSGNSGGGGGNGVNAGGGTCTLVAAIYSAWRHIGIDLLRSGSTLIQGGGGGRGGSSGGGNNVDPSGIGGGGGSGAGVQLIMVGDMNNQGVISVNGGTGFKGTAASCIAAGAIGGGGGGAGGGGGFGAYFYKTWVGNYPTANGGALAVGGAGCQGGGTGVQGIAGSPGRIILYNFLTGAWISI